VNAIRALPLGEGTTPSRASTAHVRQGIVDAAKVTARAPERRVHRAMVLTTETLITDLRRKTRAGPWRPRARRGDGLLVRTVASLAPDRSGPGGAASGGASCPYETPGVDSGDATTAAEGSKHEQGHDPAVRRRPHRDRAAVLYALIIVAFGLLFFVPSRSSRAWWGPLRRGAGAVLGAAGCALLLTVVGALLRRHRWVMTAILCAFDNSWRADRWHQGRGPGGGPYPGVPASCARLPGLWRTGHTRPGQYGGPPVSYGTPAPPAAAGIPG